MTRTHRHPFVMIATLIALAWPARALAADRVKTADGVVEGSTEASGIRAFKGIPYAAPPVGDLRFKPPQPVKSWDDVKQTVAFGPRCMQRRVYGDMGFRSNGVSEDCLYLNVWTPAKSETDRLPVLVYFYGGGFMAGDGSEPRYDGEAIARKGIVSLTVNYRLTVFGFFAHPELTSESSYHGSGNQGFLDQIQALGWVQKNIAAFGGDPTKVTIAGESAGSISVSALMVSPLSKDLIAGAIGESGAMINPTLPPLPLAQSEQNCVKFATTAGASSLAELRAMPADQLLEATAKPGTPFFAGTIDGYFLPKSPAEILAAGDQVRVPLLAGWNSEEGNARGLLGPNEATLENYTNAVRKGYGDRADEVLKLYPASTNEQVLQAATELASDGFIGYSTWKWLDLHSKTGGKPVFRYYYSHPRPPMTEAMGNAVPGMAGGVLTGNEAAAAKRPPPARGAVHSADIEYAMGNLATNKVYAWTPDDYKVSEVFLGYFANFVKNGDPNGPGLPAWPVAGSDRSVQVMHIDVNSRAEPEQHRDRYLLLDQIFTKK